MFDGHLGEVLHNLFADVWCERAPLNITWLLLKLHHSFGPTALIKDCADAGNVQILSHDCRRLFLPVKDDFLRQLLIPILAGLVA